MRIAIIALFAVLLFAASSVLFALDADMIAFIHDKTKSTMTNMCKTKMSGYTDAACACLGDKAQASIDDNQLAGCSTYNRRCMERVIETATTVALSSDNIQACINATATPGKAQAAPPPPPLSPNPLPPTSD